MSENEKLNVVVGELYDAVLNPGLWGVALQRVANFVGGRQGELRFDDLAQKFLLAGHDLGPQLQYMLMHSELYGDFDPFTEVSLLEVDEVLSLLELTPHRDEGAHHAYRERRRSGSRAAADVTVAASGTGGLGRTASEELMDGEMMRRMSLVAPHIRRAILLGKAFGRKLSEAATFSGLLDKLRAGLFLVDRDGRMLHANASGRRILHADTLLHIVNGRLVARDVAANRAIHEAMARRSSLDFDRNDIILPLTTETLERHVLHVLQGAGGDLGAGAVAATIIVCEARVEGLIDEGVIGRAYRLTPTELRVLLALFDVGGISEVAEFLGISKSTVKTHVSRLFAKTGTTRQAELVKLVAGYRSMFCT